MRGPRSAGEAANAGVLGSERIDQGRSPLPTPVSGDSDNELVAFTPAGGNLFNRAFKVRVRARMADNTATHRKGGPWSDVALLYPGNPSSRQAGTSDICDVGQRAVAGSNTYCYTNIAGSQGTLDIDNSLSLELVPGSGRPFIAVTHAAGASASADGFRVEARTSPDAWEIVSLDREWRDYC